MMPEQFPIDLSSLRPLELDPAAGALTDDQKAALGHNIQLCRDTIVFFTSLAGAKGLSGHTGGAYDTVPEVMIIRALTANGTPIVPIFYDEAGHRVATQYLLSVLNGDMPAERLLHYREFGGGLPGHPEKFLTPGIKFSSGRLGHLWAFCNGIAMANPGKSVVMLGSDGSQMEGDDAEAARLAVGKQLNIKLLVDDNNVTIAGHPQEYMEGYDLSRTLSGYGITTETTMGEDLDALFIDICRMFREPGPRALVVKRPMAAGIEGAQGSPHAHDALKANVAIQYLERRGGYGAAIAMLKAAQPEKSPMRYRGSIGVGKNRDDFGKRINEILDGMSEEDRLQTVRVFLPDILGLDDKPLYAEQPFEPGKDYVVRESPPGGGYVVATGEAVYRALDAVISLQEKGVKVGLINKPTINVADPQTMHRISIAPFVLVVEGWNVKTGLGSRFGSYLLKEGFRGKYDHIGVHKEGNGGQWQQMGYQGLDPSGIATAILSLT
jgi:transketolase